MKKKTELKDNNISSKLLGTNIQDINIDKFRDITNLNKQKYQLNSKLTVPILKTLTNKFSVDIIFSITLPDQSLSNIDALQMCENLMVLNLANNNITSLNPLNKMKQLKFLNVSNNSIGSLQPLKNLEGLLNVHLEGNTIRNLSDIKSLENCENLRTLYLQSLAGNQANPICSANNYRANIFETLNILKRLDGVPKNTELNNGVELAKKNKKDLKIQLKNNGFFYTNKFPTVSTSYNSIAGQNQLKKSIANCKNSISSLQMRLKAALIK